MSFTKTQNKFSKGIDDKADGTAVTIDEDGKVGVGTSDPSTLLDIRGGGGGSLGDARDSAQQLLIVPASGVASMKFVANESQICYGNTSALGKLAFVNRGTGGSGTTAMTIDPDGNVGIGMTPTRSTFDLTAKEQLKEWKTKAKKASWPIVTDGAFEQEPTEDLVEQWIETRAAGDKLQVNGNGFFTGPVEAQSHLIANGQAGAFGMLGSTRIEAFDTADKKLAFFAGTKLVSRFSDDGDATFSGSVTATSIGSAQTSISFGVGQNRIYPNKDGSISDGTVDIGQGGGTPYRFKDGFFSGTVNAKSASFIPNGSGKALELRDNTTGNNTSFRAIHFQTDNEAGACYIDYLRGGSSGNGSLIFGTAPAGDVLTLDNAGDATFSGTVSDSSGPLMSTRGLITTLTTLRKATQDETTLEGLRDSIGNAIGGLIEKFEAEIAAMPAPEVGTMDA